MYRCLVQMKQKVIFTGPGRVVTGASTELAIPAIAAARCEGGAFGRSKRRLSEDHVSRKPF